MRSTGKPPFRTSSLVASGNGMIAVGGNVYVNGKRVPKSDHAQLRGSGRSSTETRDCSHFHAVRVSGVAEVTLALGDPHVSVTFDDNLLACVVTGVESGVLTIATRGNWSAESTAARCGSLSDAELNGSERSRARKRRAAAHSGAGMLAVWRERAPRHGIGRLPQGRSFRLKLARCERSSRYRRGRFTVWRFHGACLRTAFSMRQPLWCGKPSCRRTASDPQRSRTSRGSSFIFDLGALVTAECNFHRPCRRPKRRLCQISNSVRLA